MVVNGTAQVDELQRRVAALMRIQQEMRAHQTLIKEFDTNYVTPPPSAPLGELQMPHMQPPHSSTIAQHIPQVSPSTIEHGMRRPGSPLGVNVNVPTPNQNKCDFVSPVPQQPTLAESTYSQQSMHTLGQLNINQLLNQQQQPSGQQNGQTSLLPLIQKFLSGEFGREDKTLDQQSIQQRPQPQPTGTSLALNQLIGNNSAASSVQPSSQQISPIAQPTQQPQDQMLYPGLHANLLNAFASSMAAPAQANYLQQQQITGAPLQQPNSMLDLLQQALLRQQHQNNLFSLLQQNREQLAKLAGVNAPTPSDFLVAPQPTLNEKVTNFVNPTQNPTLLSPPLSSNSPFSSEKSPTPIELAPVAEKSVTPTAHVFATPPATLKSKEKPAKKTKKQLKLEAAAQNAQNGTPVSGRKRQLNGKRETKAEKRARLDAGKSTKLAFAPRELTENENIALEVLTGLANGRFQ